MSTSGASSRPGPRPAASSSPSSDAAATPSRPVVHVFKSLIPKLVVSNLHTRLTPLYGSGLAGFLAGLAQAITALLLRAPFALEKRWEMSERRSVSLTSNTGLGWIALLLLRTAVGQSVYYAVWGKLGQRNPRLQNVRAHLGNVMTIVLAAFGYRLATMAVNRLWSRYIFALPDRRLSDSQDDQDGNHGSAGGASQGRIGSSRIDDDLLDEDDLGRAVDSSSGFSRVRSSSGGISALQHWKLLERQVNDTIMAGFPLVMTEALRGFQLHRRLAQRRSEMIELGPAAFGLDL
ncbi:uncharacterized protein BJ171DRAFT_275786 [Polychytrium aggregatum]|uniref:uncharacterized protein n=1 Tax=Polychytrium aggregatum TaxID=110093 RepID=UPI0022FF107B|nr:uncharacterized protein BJ171DRAFT_275786 [Polychytrium aggregatum]KAI9207451.1 hypothetical protein BJ171DRAFT_275786 [Polychytrium aggregatum]